MDFIASRLNVWSPYSILGELLVLSHYPCYSPAKGPGITHPTHEGPQPLIVPDFLIESNHFLAYKFDILLESFDVLEDPTY